MLAIMPILPILCICKNPTCAKNNPIYFLFSFCPYKIQYYLKPIRSVCLWLVIKCLFPYVCLSVHTSSEIVSFTNCAVAGLKGRGHKGRPPSPGVQNLSISCSFGENHMLAPPSPQRFGVPTAGKSWIRNCCHLNCNMWKYDNKEKSRPWAI